MVAKRFRVVENGDPTRLLGATNDLDEACALLHGLPLLTSLGDREVYATTYLGLPEKAVRLRDAREHVAYRPRRGAVIFDRGHVLQLSGEEVAYHAYRHHEARRAEWEAMRPHHFCHGRKVSAYQARRAFRGPVEAIEPLDDEAQGRSVRFKHIIVGWGDPDTLYKRVSKCWKDQSKRRHQYRTIEMPA